MEPEHLPVAMTAAHSEGARACAYSLELWTWHHLQSRLEQHLGQLLLAGWHSGFAPLQNLPF
jgi:hypothetical protein